MVTFLLTQVSLSLGCECSVGRDYLLLTLASEAPEKNLRAGDVPVFISLVENSWGAFIPISQKNRWSQGGQKLLAQACGAKGQA